MTAMKRSGILQPFLKMHTDRFLLILALSREHSPRYKHEKFCATCKIIYPLSYRNCDGYPNKQISGCGHILRTYPKAKNARDKRLREVPRY